MKKYTAIMLAILFIIIFPLNAAAHSPAQGWYFKKTKDHTQPILDGNLCFIEDYNAYYVDKAHCDYNDKEKVIYLTFDAGYENGNIAKIMDIMKAENVQGSFFILENLVDRNRDLVKRMNSEGHLICNHTANHPDMTKYTNIDDFKKELDELSDSCKSKLNIDVAPFFRPPEGKFNETTLKFAKELGYTTVFWSFAYADWDNNNQICPETALEKLKSGTHNGEILLLHPTSATNAAILSDYIHYLKDNGFRFALLSELA